MFTVVVCFHTRVQIHLHYSQEFAAHIAYDVALTVHFLLPFRLIPNHKAGLPR